jgi:hypothetical protein
MAENETLLTANPVSWRPGVERYALLNKSISYAKYGIASNLLTLIGIVALAAGGVFTTGLLFWTSSLLLGLQVCGYALRLFQHHTAMNGAFRFGLNTLLNNP